MTVAEIVLAITLVAGAGWLISGFAALRSTDAGFVAADRLVFDVSFQGSRYRDPPSVLAASENLLDRLRALPGVAAAGATLNMPLRTTPENSLFVAIRGQAVDPNRTMNSRQRAVSPGFFEAMGIRLLSGRDFTRADRPDTTRVAIVNRTFARNYLSGVDPIGVRFTSGYPQINPNSEVTVVGVVDDVRQRSITAAPEPAYYTSHTQGPSRRQAIVVATKGTDPAGLQSVIREEVRKLDPQIAVEFERVSDLVASTLRRQQLGMTLMLLFGATAVALAAVGIYGVVAYAAGQRRLELATRLALGAAPRDVFWLVLKQGRTLALIGIVVGLGVAFIAGRIVSSRIYEVRASDPMILGGATLIVAAIALLATTIPAFRSARLDPARVLRPE